MTQPYSLQPKRVKPSQYITIYLPRKLLKKVRQYIERRYGDASARALSLTVREALIFYLESNSGEKQTETKGEEIADGNKKGNVGN